MKILKKNSAYIIEIEQSEKETGRTMYNTRHELAKLITHKERLQSNWNSLREWLEEQIKDTVKFKNALGYSHEDKHFQKMLDKMNELESDENERKNI